MDYIQIIHALDLFGTAVFAISGCLAAGRKKMDIFGVVVLGMATALGGGTLRDILLDSGPVFWINDRAYLAVVIIVSLLTFTWVRVFPVPRRGLTVSDAFGLAVFTVIGSAKALQATGSESVAVLMGMTTGVMGGMIRDILSAEVPLILRREIYATASLCGGVVFVVMNRLSFSEVACIAVSVAATLCIRLAAIHWRLELPMFSAREENPGIRPDDHDAA